MAQLNVDHPDVGGEIGLGPVAAFALDKVGPVAGQDVAQHRVVLLHGLNDDLAAAVAASGPARYLGHEVVGAFVGTEVGEAQQLVGGDDADQPDAFEVEPLGYHLGADEHVEPTGLEAGDEGRQGVFAADGVGVHPADADVGEEDLELVLDLLGAGARELKTGVAAGGAGFGDAGGIAAAVAAQPVLELVEGEADVAVDAADGVVAGRAEVHGGIAAAVLEENGLFAPFESGFKFPDQGRGEEGVATALAVVFPGVGDDDLGQFDTAEAFGHGDEAELAAGGVFPALQARGGGTEDDVGPVLPGQDEGDVAAVVAGVWFLLLVAGVVLLVDHHQAEVFERQEEGRTGADDGGLSRQHRPPDLDPLHVVEPGVVNGDPVAEHPLEAADDLAGQRDLR